MAILISTYEIHLTKFGMISGVDPLKINTSVGGLKDMPRYRRSFRRPRRKMGNVVMHVPSSMAGTLASNTSKVFVIESPSIFAAGSASSNIEAQDKDRTVNVGHHIGTINIDFAIRSPANDGVYEFCLYKVERAATTPVLGTHPVPSTATIASVGMQQACRMANPGKVFHFSKRVYTQEVDVVHKIKVSPAKFKLSKVKAGDHWILQVFNRGAAIVTDDFECRYKEYE